MAFEERIRVLIDVVTDRSVTAVKGFRQSIADADGTVGKFKAGAGAAFDSIKQNAGALALGAGTALVAFGAKAVGAFTDMAKAALDFGAATGLAVEDASRWIAIGDDVQVSAEQMETAFARVGKSLDSGTWEKYGIATRDAGGNVRNTNDILLDSLSHLSSIEDQTTRTRVGNELFGRGYANIAPLIGHTRAEYEGMLRSVEKGQVITRDEAARAERWRLAQDALNDAIQEATLAVGGLVAELAPAIETIADGVGTVTRFADALHLTEAAAVAAANAMSPALGAMQLWNTAVEKGVTSTDEIIASMLEQGATLDMVRQKFLDDGVAVEKVNEVIEDYVARHADATTATGDLAAQLEAEEQSLEDAAAAQELAAKAAREHTASLEEQRKGTDRAREAIEGLMDATRAAIDADFAVRRSRRDAADATAAYTRVVDDGEATERDRIEALEDAQQAALDLADAVWRKRQAEAEANGETLTSLDRAAVYRNELLLLAATADGPLRDAILAYVDDLGRVPDHVGTTVTADTSAARDALHALMADLDFLEQRASLIRLGRTVQTGPRAARADGGPVPGSRGTPVTITAHGGEFVLDADTVDAIRNGAVSKGTGRDRGDETGTTIINNDNSVHNIQAFPGTLLARQLFDIDDRHRRRNGYPTVRPRW